MKTRSTAMLVSLALVSSVSLSYTTFAQQNASASTAGLGQVAMAKQVYGHQVLGSDNQKIGNLNNLVVDLESGRILYGVVGTGKNRVGVPPQIFTQTTPTSNELRVNVDKQKVDGAPQFDSIDKSGEWASAAFASQVYSYFGQSPWWQGSGPANEGSFHNVHKASQVMGLSVQNVNNQNVGKIHNIAVDLPDGRIVALVLSPDSSLNLGDNLYPMPPQAFTLGSDKKNLVSNIDASKLASAPHYASNNAPNFSDANYIAQVYQFYGKQTWFGTGGAQPTGR